MGVVSKTSSKYFYEYLRPSLKLLKLCKAATFINAQSSVTARIDRFHSEIFHLDITVSMKVNWSERNVRYPTTILPFVIVSLSSQISHSLNIICARWCLNNGGDFNIKVPVFSIRSLLIQKSFHINPGACYRMCEHVYVILWHKSKCSNEKKFAHT